MERRTKGLHFEAMAQQYLSRNGIRMVESNFNTRKGEIDLIGYDRNTIVFFEVRYRKSSEYGSPFETITISKQRKIINAANFYLQKHKLWRVDARFDAIAITDNISNGNPCIEWIKSAFTL